VQQNGEIQMPIDLELLKGLDEFWQSDEKEKRAAEGKG
jgi:hypothetical protein